MLREQSQKRDERLKALIKREFIASNMSDSKWRKLLQLAAANSASVPVMNYKLVGELAVRLSYNEPHPEQIEESWFREPILYRELEWVEFPCRRIDPDTNTWVAQDLSELRAALLAAAHFPIHEHGSGLRIVAYVKAQQGVQGPTSPPSAGPRP